MLERKNNFKTKKNKKKFFNKISLSGFHLLSKNKIKFKHMTKRLSLKKGFKSTIKN